MTRDPDESPADALDRYLTEVDHVSPERKPPKRWGGATKILAVVEVGIVGAVLVWWFRWR